MVNFGIIGCGKIGVRHINFLKNIDGTKVLAVTDLIEERAKQAATSYSDFVRVFIDYRDLLKMSDIDIVNVCTPSGLHAQMSIAALNAGKHVICEKPMALSVHDADKMIEASKLNNKKLFVVKQNRFNLPIKILKEVLDKNMLGKIHSISSNVIWNRRPDYYIEEKWRGTLNLDGGALATQASHFLDIMQWLGGPIKSIFAKTDRFVHKEIETEDTGAILLKFNSGALGTMYYTTAAYNKNIEGSITILGTRGSVKIGGEYLNKIEYWNVEGFPFPENSEETSPANEYGSYRGSASKHDFVFREAIKKIIGDENAHDVDGIEGRKTVELIESVHLSSKLGKEIFLPLKEEIKEAKEIKNEIIERKNYSDLNIEDTSYFKIVREMASKKNEFRKDD